MLLRIQYKVARQPMALQNYRGFETTIHTSIDSRDYPVCKDQIQLSLEKAKMFCNKTKQCTLFYGWIDHYQYHTWIREGQGKKMTEHESTN
jgi:hypothetical protein